MDYVQSSKKLFNKKNKMKREKKNYDTFRILHLSWKYLFFLLLLLFLYFMSTSISKDTSLLFLLLASNWTLKIKWFDWSKRVFLIARENNSETFWWILMYNFGMSIIETNSITVASRPWTKISQCNKEESKN